MRVSKQQAAMYNLKECKILHKGNVQGNNNNVLYHVLTLFQRSEFNRKKLNVKAKRLLTNKGLQTETSI